MKKIIEFLESDETLLRAAMMLMAIYAIHNAYILHELEHFDLAISIGGNDYNFFKPMVSIAAAFITEFVVLILFVKGEKLFGHLYAVGLFALNTFYYCYFMPVKKVELIIVACFVSFIHFAAIWYLSDIFYKRRNEKAVEKDIGTKPVVKKAITEKQIIATIPIEKTIPLENELKPAIINAIAVKQEISEHGSMFSINNTSLECPVCTVPFSRKFTLDRHLKNKHPEYATTTNYKEAV